MLVSDNSIIATANLAHSVWCAFQGVLFKKILDNYLKNRDCCTVYKMWRKEALEFGREARVFPVEKLSSNISTSYQACVVT